MSTEVTLFDYFDTPGRPHITGVVDSNGNAQVRVGGKPGVNGAPIVPGSNLAAIATDGSGNTTGIYGQVNGVPNQVIALGGGGGSGLPTYLGQVATRCFYPWAKQASYTQAMIRSSHFMRDNVTQLKLVWQDNYQGNDQTSGSPTTIECAVEYPAGTYTRVTFAGSNQGVMANGGTLISDFCNVTIPRDARFWLRTYRLNASGLIYCNTIGMNANAPAGEATDAGASVVNKVMGGTITGAWYPSTPAAIVGMTTRPSFFLFGDSRMLGINEFSGNTSITGDGGEVARSIGPQFAYIQNGITGAALVGSVSYPGRIAMLQYCSHVITAFGINDVIANSTGYAAMVTAYNTQWAALSNGGVRPVYQTTLPPLGGTTTDAWATVANQTPHANDPIRVQVNAYIRSQGDTTNLTGYLEVADAIESGRDTGKWKAPGYTTDGGHESITGGMAIVASGAINPALFVRRV